jgi:hypothetical protein
MEGLEFLLGIPSKYEIRATTIAHIDGWVAGHKIARFYAISNRVDNNRNIIWEFAKKIDNDVIMLDTDVAPITPLSDVIQFLKEDFKEYDIVFAPLMGHTNNILFQPYNIDDYVKDTPFPIRLSGMGFVAFSKHLVETLKPYTYQEYIEDALYLSDIPEEEKNKIIEIVKNKGKANDAMIYNGLGNTPNIYFAYTPTLSEDTMFCARMRKLEIKMAVDPRIKCNHMSEIPLNYNKELIAKAVEEVKQKEAIAKATAENVEVKN